MNQPLILEACVENMPECAHAKLFGAHQLEVCSHMDQDGLTPDTTFIKEIKREIGLPLKVMIRCRGGNFEYSRQEMDEMIESIHAFKAIGVAGFVFGALVRDDSDHIRLDLEAIRTVCEEAYPIPVTIHKAIDLCTDIPHEVKLLKSVPNAKFILSSGGKNTAIEGARMLKMMKKIGAPELKIIAAGKVTNSNLKEVISLTSLSHFHGRKIV
jgi:copper homeostasis protein